MVWLWRYDGEFFPSEAVFIVPSHFFLANSWTPRNRPRTAFPPGIPRDSSRVAVSLPNTYHFKPAPEELPEELLLTRHQGAPYSQLFLNLIRFIRTVFAYFVIYANFMHFFGSFASCSLQNICANSHTKIGFDTKQIHVEANIASE